MTMRFDVASQILIDELPDCLLVVDEAGIIVYANPATERLLGYLPDLLVGEPIELVVPVPDRHEHADLRRRYLEDPVARRMGADRIVAARHSDGDRVDVEVSLVPLAVEPPATMVVVRDTALERAQRERMQAEIELVVGMARGTGSEAALQLALEHTRSAVHADAAWLWLRTDDDRLAMVAGADHAHDVVSGVSIDAILAATDGRSAVTLLDAATPGHPLDGYTALGYGPLVVARVGHGDPRGLLVMARHAGRRPFESAHRRAAEEFADVALVALDLEHARAALERLAVASDRERIARELHDSIIQRLFADGLRLQNLADLAPSGFAEPVLEVISAVTRDLETMIVELRLAIFDLQRDPPGVPIADVVRALVDDFAAPAGLATGVQIDDGLDGRIPARVRVEALAALRECLANVVRHANAANVAVSLGMRDGHLAVAVADDGIGPPDLPAVRGNGLQNLATRAAALGGRFELQRSHPRGTAVLWTVPIR
jgi:PAS domain S-box-containing protein